MVRGTDSGGNGDRSEREFTAAIRGIHLVPDAPPIDVYVDDERIVENLAFDEVSEYIPVETGRPDVSITEADDRDAVLAERDIFIGDAYYTAVAIGRLASNQVTLGFPRDVGSALFRFANSTPDAPAIDAYVNGVQVATDISFNDDAEYAALPEASYTVELRRAGADETLGTDEISVEQGVAYTGYAISLDTIRLVEDGP